LWRSATRGESNTKLWLTDHTAIDGAANKKDGYKD
jgi:hypothetical protein